MRTLSEAFTLSQHGGDGGNRHLALLFRRFLNFVSAWYRYGTVLVTKTEISIIRPRARLVLFMWPRSHDIGYNLY
nr:MAG TPA: hypothetical protein [Caudoviricetes sp.]